jgi:hypothetical protein
MPKLKDLLDSTNTAISIIRDLIITEAKENLSKGGKYGSYNASGSLNDSLKPIDTTDENGVVETGISMNVYGEFVDKGVSGIKKKYATEFKYTNKMPPAPKLDKWIVRRGIAPRDEKGRFIPRKNVAWMIANGIFQNGIKPTLFLTKPFERYTKNMKQEIAEAFGEDVQKYVEILFKENE